MTTAYAAPNTATMTDVPLAWLVQSFYNPRRTFSDEALDELAASLEEHGMLEPIVVREVQWPTTVQIHGADGKLVPCLEIIAGERRWRAAHRAGMETVPVRVLTNVDDHAALKLSIVENLQRVDLDPIEEAQGYAALHDHAGMKQTEIAAAVKRSQPAIAKAMGLLKLPDSVQELIRDGTLSPGHGHILEKFAPFPQYLEALVKIVVDNAWTTKALAEKKTYVGYQMTQTGIVRAISGETRFDHKVCESCPFGAYRAAEYQGHYCLKPEHYDELQAAAIQEQKERLAVAVAAGVTDGKPVLQISAMQYDDYRRLGSYTVPAACTPACPCRAQAAAPSGQIVLICTNPKRFDQLIAAEKRANTKVKRERITAQLAAVGEQLQDLDEVRATELAMLVWSTVAQVGEKAWRAAAKECGLLEFLPEKGNPTQDDLARLAPMDLVRLAVDALLTHELTRAIDSEFYGTPYYNWYQQAQRAAAPQVEQ